MNKIEEIERKRKTFIKILKDNEQRYPFFTIKIMLKLTSLERYNENDLYVLINYFYKNEKVISKFEIDGEVIPGVYFLPNQLASFKKEIKSWNNEEDILKYFEILKMSGIFVVKYESILNFLNENNLTSQNTLYYYSIFLDQSISKLFNTIFKKEKIVSIRIYDSWKEEEFQENNFNISINVFNSNLKKINKVDDENLRKVWELFLKKNGYYDWETGEIYFEKVFLKIIQLERKSSSKNLSFNDKFYKWFFRTYMK